MPRQLAGADCEVDLILILTFRAHIVTQTVPGREVKRLFAGHGRPGRGPTPGLFMHAEIMDRCFVLQPRIPTHEVMIEEA